MSEGSEAYEGLAFVTDASIQARAETDGASTEALLEKVKKVVPDPSLFDEEGRAPFFWDATISNSQIDSYFTRMHETTLRNYAEDAVRGVAFMDSHNIYKMGIGHSLEGRFEGTTAANMRVDATFYTIPGLTLGGVNTSDFIDGVRGGLNRQVSVGFSPGRFECSLCEGDPFDWWTGTCPHVPGLKYDKDGNPERAVKGKAKKDEKLTLCYAWVIDGHLREVSAVYKGATPGAHITKIRVMALKGELPEGTIALAERQFRIHVPRRILVAAGNGRVEERIVTGGLLTMPEQRHEEPVEEPQAQPVADAATDTPEVEAVPEQPEDGTTGEDQEQIEAAGDAEPADATEDVEAAQDGEPEERMTGQGAPIDQTATLRGLLKELGVEAATDPMETVRSVCTELQALRPRAEMGDRYFATVVDETLKAGVAAMGDRFDQERHKRILESYPRNADGLELATAMRDSFQEMVEARFQGGGRKTTDTDNDPPASRTEDPKAADEDPDRAIANLRQYRTGTRL